MIVWRYLETGKVQHALDSSRYHAACGRAPVWYFPKWFGETDDERQILRTLPGCSRCARKGYFPDKDDE